MTEELKNESKSETAVSCFEKGTARPDVYVRPRYSTRRVDDEAWELGVVVPGVKKEDVSVSLDDGQLEVIAHRSDELPEGWRPIYERTPAADYRLQLELAIDVDPDRISAKLEDGVLTLRLPVAEASKPKTILVE